MGIALAPDATAKVVFTGGGPTALATACVLAKGGIPVVVLERNLNYLRTDINLRVDAASMVGLASIDDEMKAKVKEWSARRIPISELEETLEAKANELGVRIIKGVTADPTQLQAQFPNARVFVGADGSRSKTREAMSGKEFKFNTTHQYVINVQYKIQLDEPLIIGCVSDALETYRRLKLANYFVAEHRTLVGENDDCYNVRLQIPGGQQKCSSGPNEP